MFKQCGKGQVFAEGLTVYEKGFWGIEKPLYKNGGDIVDLFSLVDKDYEKIVIPAHMKTL